MKERREELVVLGHDGGDSEDVTQRAQGGHCGHHEQHAQAVPVLLLFLLIHRAAAVPAVELCVGVLLPLLVLLLLLEEGEQVLVAAHNARKPRPYRRLRDPAQHVFAGRGHLRAHLSCIPPAREAQGVTERRQRPARNGKLLSSHQKVQTLQEGITEQQDKHNPV
ncbi:hypothetical protein E2C01_059856 [Portunus trituberculatus]|uniref:Uncharacterized protein n=1 Tax=Portunus trituberculatus TaxID=210409 RepID=A0A5B7GZK0_PORTR|nr:hypothetical protein [Portunus trituberculatus]